MKSTRIWDFWADKYERLWVQKYSLFPTRREIVKEIKKTLKHGIAYRVLDMGCGTGQLIRKMQREFRAFNITYTGVDISSRMIEMARSQDRDSTYINSSVEEFAAPDGEFDIIVCSHSFPYYTDKKDALCKFSSLLKDGGHLYLAQASVNTVYDSLAMFFVKFTTSSAVYWSEKKIRKMTADLFEAIREGRIKERWYMPSICLFVLKKAGRTYEDSACTSEAS